MIGAMHVKGKGCMGSVKSQLGDFPLPPAWGPSHGWIWDVSIPNQACYRKDCRDSPLREEAPVWGCMGDGRQAGY